MDYDVESDGKTSFKSRLDLSMLDNILIKDLPEIIKEKLLSILRLQKQRMRRKKKKQIATSMNGPDSVEGNYAQSENTSESFYIQGFDDEDTEHDSNLIENGIRASVKMTRMRRENSGKQGRGQRTGEGLGNMSEQETRKYNFYSMVVIGRLRLRLSLGNNHGKWE